MNKPTVLASEGPKLLTRTRSPFDPRGQVHLPIGIPDTVDTLKTIVEPESCFSPGIGSYGVYFWLYERDTGRLITPTQDGGSCEFGLTPEGYLIPWTSWRLGDVDIRHDLCHVRLDCPGGRTHVAAARVTLANSSAASRDMSLLVVVRGMGPAGWPIRSMRTSANGLHVEDHTAVVARRKPSRITVHEQDNMHEWAGNVQDRGQTSAASADGNCSGAMAFDLTIAGNATETIDLVFPVLAGRRAVGHAWDRTNPWFQLDLAIPNPHEGGELQPDPGEGFYRSLDVSRLFEQARVYWQNLVGNTCVSVPDARWSRAITAVVQHLAMVLNEGAPDLAVYSLNVFNRDGVYMAQMLQAYGQTELARVYLDYMIAHPFSGRVQPEADNPGQLLWVLGQHYLLTRDRAWLERVYPAVRKLATMIRYCRTTPGPHYVCDDSLDFGDALPEAVRKELKPGACDGYNPRYTDAFDIAGLRSAAMLAGELSESAEQGDWCRLADAFMQKYDQKYGAKLGVGYGNYAVLWPCRLYPLKHGKTHDEFVTYGPRKTGEWRYFPLASAHQGLLAGNRAAGWQTVAWHLEEEQMRNWYMMDEGGPSGTGGWGHLRTTWSWDMPKYGWSQNSARAMPDGWGLAELCLLMRDSLLHEDGDRLVLFAGVPAEWFQEEITLKEMPTHFGRCNVEYRKGRLRVSGIAAPGGVFVRLPQGGEIAIGSEGGTVEVSL